MRILLALTVLLALGVFIGPVPWPMVGLPLTLRQLRREFATIRSAHRGAPDLRTALLAGAIRAEGE